MDEDGLSEEEFEASAATLTSLASSLDADCVLLRRKQCGKGMAAQYLIRKKVDEHDFLEIRLACLVFFFSFFLFLLLNCSFHHLRTSLMVTCIFRVAVVGNVDAGKSTLLGVLTHGELDNGRGHARQKLFRHKHEQETGRTSSVGNDILGFDNKGIL